MRAEGLHQVNKVLQNFAVLMCVYRKDDLELFKKAVESVFANTHQPENFCLIVDGPVAPFMDNFIRNNICVRKNVTVHWRSKNYGLTSCLNFGLMQIHQDFIIRADSDDLNLPDRFDKLYTKMRDGFDLVGSHATEYVASDGAQYEKTLPITSEKIRGYAAMRNPFLHMTVCYNRELAISLGGYPEILYREDYGLWLKFIGNNARVANLDEVLVRASWGDNFVKRRASGSVIREELKLLVLKFRYLPRKYYVNIILAFFLRVFPLLLGGKTLDFLYKNIIRKHKGNQNGK